jgi:hypothetical protein
VVDLVPPYPALRPVFRAWRRLEQELRSAGISDPRLRRLADLTYTTIAVTVFARAARAAEPAPEPLME